VGEAASSANAIVAHTEPMQKIELMPNDIKLEGVRNYLSWSSRALLILKTEGLESDRIRRGESFATHCGLSRISYI
jgi:hypothetical protein